MSVGKQFLEEFIEIYKNEVALWQVKNEKYRDKNARRKSLNILLRKTREYEKGATMEQVKKKINSIRTSYRRELQKVRKSEKLDADDYGVYVPSIWYYGLLDFLRDQYFPSEDGNNSAINDPLEYKRKLEIIQNPTPTKKLKYIEEDSLLMESPTPPEMQNVIDEEYQQIEQSPIPIAAKKKITEEDFLQIAADHLEKVKKQPARDEADIFSEGWAMMYRKLDGEQKIFAKRIIDETLMHGHFGQLTYESSLNYFDGKD